MWLFFTKCPYPKSLHCVSNQHSCKILIISCGDRRVVSAEKGAWFHPRFSISCATLQRQPAVVCQVAWVWPCLSTRSGQQYLAPCGQLPPGRPKSADFPPHAGHRPTGVRVAPRKKDAKVRASRAPRTGPVRTCQHPASHRASDARLGRRGRAKSTLVPVVSAAAGVAPSPPGRCPQTTSPTCGLGTMKWNAWFTVSGPPAPHLAPMLGALDECHRRDFWHWVLVDYAP